MLVFWFVSLTQMVRYDSVDGKYICSFLFWFMVAPLRVSYLTYVFDFPSTLSPKVYDGDSYLTSLGRMVTA